MEEIEIYDAVNSIRIYNFSDQSRTFTSIPRSRAMSNSLFSFISFSFGRIYMYARTYVYIEV